MRYFSAELPENSATRMMFIMQHICELHTFLRSQDVSIHRWRHGGEGKDELSRCFCLSHFMYTIVGRI